MKNMTTLGKVFDKVDEMSKNCTDKLIDVKSVSFNHLESVNIGPESHRMRPIAQRSFCYRLGIPFQYLRRCPPDVQEFNMNHWIQEERNEQLFFRFDGQQVRALFTPRYTPVDNFEVLERLDSLGYRPDTQVQCHLDDEFMSLSIPDGNKTFSVNGDRMTPGVSVSNSEVGLASLSIASFTLRLVCANGLISKTEISASYRHVSSKVLTEFPEVLDRVSYELGKQRDQFRLSLETPVDNPQSTIKNFNHQFQLAQPEKEAVEWAWPLEAGSTMYNVVNTYTRAAQFTGLSAVSSHALQKVGGNILGMLK